MKMLVIGSCTGSKDVGSFEQPSPIRTVPSKL